MSTANDRPAGIHNCSEIDLGLAGRRHLVLDQKGKQECQGYAAEEF